MGAAILDCFATGVLLGDLEADPFFFVIVPIISLTDFDSRGWNAGRGLVADDCYSAGACKYMAASSGCSRMVVLRGLELGVHGLVADARCWAEAG